MASLTATAPIEVALPSTTASATILHPTSATRTRFQLTPDRVRGCDSCPACTAPQRGAAEAHAIIGDPLS